MKKSVSFASQSDSTSSAKVSARRFSTAVVSRRCSSARPLRMKLPMNTGLVHAARSGRAGEDESGRSASCASLIVLKRRGREGAVKNSSATTTSSNSLSVASARRTLT